MDPRIAQAIAWQHLTPDQVWGVMVVKRAALIDAAFGGDGTTLLHEGREASVIRWFLAVIDKRGRWMSRPLLSPWDRCDPRVNDSGTYYDPELGEYVLQGPPPWAAGSLIWGEIPPGEDARLAFEALTLAA